MRTWDHFKWWLLFGLIVWLLLVVVFLIDHSRGYSWPMISERIWRTVGEIVLLKWVSKYQTLIAGIAALIGASFVYLTAKYSASEAEKSEKKRRRSDSIAACALVAQDFHEAAYQAQYYATEKKLSFFLHTSTYLPSIAKVNTTLASIVSSMKLDTVLFIEKDSKNASINRHHETALKCYMVWQILMHVSQNLESDGTYELHNDGSISVLELKRYINILICKPEDVISLYGFFDWSK